MQMKPTERYFFFGFLLVVFVLVFLIFRPFLAIIVVGASLSVVLYPVYRYVREKLNMKNGWLAALLTVLLFIIIFGGPLFGLSLIVFHQLQEVYVSVTAGNANVLDTVTNSIARMVPDAIPIDISAKVADFVSYLTSNISVAFTATLSIIFSTLLVILTTFYFLKDGSVWRKAFVDLSPLSTEQNEKILNRLAIAVNGIIRGYFVIAIAQGTMMGLGLLIFGVPHPALWGVVAAVASLVPTVGTAIVAVPAILFLAAMNQTPQAIGFTIWSVMIVGTMDNLLSPIIVGSKTNVPSLLVLFSILGGVTFMGPVGILVGPLAVSLLYTLVAMYQSDIVAKEKV